MGLCHGEGLRVRAVASFNGRGTPEDDGFGALAFVIGAAFVLCALGLLWLVNCAEAR